MTTNEFKLKEETIPNEHDAIDMKRLQSIFNGTNNNEMNR